jgi:serine/threonine-protein kinase
VVLSLVADLTRKPPFAVSEAEVTTALAAGDAPLLPEEARRTLDALVHQGTLRRRRERYVVCGELLAEWLCARHPFAQTAAAVRDFVGPFQLLEPLGEGGMGIVYKARDLISKRVVALKLMTPAAIDNQDARRRFMREAEVGLRLLHPHIVRVHARGEHEQRCFIAMEYLEGITLRRHVRGNGPMPWREAFEVAGCIADALGAVHAQGAVHRDVKSENIMLVGPARVPKLMDFGLAHCADRSVLTHSHALLGTMPYMAPEQVAGEDPDASWDLYALGVVLFETLTGRLPFIETTTIRLLRQIASEPPPSPRDLGVAVPDAAQALLLRLLAKAPADRPSSAAVLVAELDALLAAEPAPPERG